MNDVDAIVELEGGSIKFGTDQGEYCFVTNEVAMADFDTDEMHLGGSRISVRRFATPQERDRYANSHQPGEILEMRGWLDERPGTGNGSARSTGGLILGCLEDWMKVVEEGSVAFGSLDEKAFQVELAERMARSREVLVEKYLKDQGDGRTVLAGWAPGGLDLEISSTDGPVWAELKWAKRYGTLFNCLWDVAKLAAGLREGVAAEGFLVAGAPVAEWERNHPYKEFFRFSTHTGSSLFADHEKSWRGWYEENQDTYPKAIATPISTIPVGQAVGRDATGEEWAIKVSRIVAPGAETFPADDFST